MIRTLLLSITALSLAVATSALAQTTKPNPFLTVLYQLSQSVEAIADDAARVCRLDLTSLPQAGRNLSKLKRIEADLSELRKRYGARSDFPAAEARRIGGRIESIEASLVRLKGAPHLVQDRDDGPDATGQIFFEAAQTLCGDAEGIFEDVCKAQGGTPSETCESCFFGLLTCCEKFCTVS